MRKPIHLPGSRKRWAFSQKELAHLAGVRPSIISRYERGVLTPGARTFIALEIVFGRCGRRLFPSLYREVEEEVMRRAAHLDRSLRHADDPASNRKRDLLREMAQRAEPRSKL